MNNTQNVNKNSEVTFNFKNIVSEESTSVNWLQPGNYKLGIIGAKYIKPEEKKSDGSVKSPYLLVSFQGKDGKVDSHMYITPKTLMRLQYLYTNWFDKECERDFSNEKNPIDAIGMFFEKAFSSDTAKKIEKSILVGGKTSTTGRVFAEVPYTKFIIPEDKEVVYGPFAPNSVDYILNVKGTPATPATHTDSAILTDSDPWNNSTSDDDSSDLPF